MRLLYKVTSLELIVRIKLFYPTLVTEVPGSTHSKTS